MKWYIGGIAEAVSVSKTKGAIFVVYIEGSDDHSKLITESVENGALGQGLDNDHFVAIKIEAGSVPHQQFSEIFGEPSVPSIYFIGKNGAPLDVITATDGLENVSKRIENILTKGGVTVQKTGANISESLIQNEQATENSNNVVCDNGVCTIRTSPGSSNVEVSQNVEQEINPSTSLESQVKELSQEEKVQKAKELLEKKRLEKEQEEKERERNKEIERRQMGQGVQQLKKWQEDQELKQLKEEREKEKRENQQARERVLAQIAQDKAERLSKSQSQSPPPEPPKTTPSQPTPKPSSSTSRLQFKLPDGSSSMQEFPNSDSLQSVFNFVKANLKVASANFRLSTVFPRREFTQDDYSQTLLDLQLFPTAVILVLPINRGTVATNPAGNLSTMMWSLFAPLFNLFGYLRNLVFGTGSSTGSNKRQSEGNDDARQDQPKRVMRDSTVIRRQGNVHRLGDRRDSDEDGNTWNGNSTQQM